MAWNCYNPDMTAKSLSAAAFVLCIGIILSAAACTCTPNDPLQGNLKVFPGNADEGAAQPSAPAVQQPAVSTAPPTQETTRQVTVTEANSYFSIGIPAGYTEERWITAARPIDIWFEYLTPDMTLEVNGTQVQIPIRRTTAKTGYFPGVTQVKYVMKNTSAQYLSYNLRMLPVNIDQVSVTTREKWTAP